MRTTGAAVPVIEARQIKAGGAEYGIQKQHTWKIFQARPTKSEKAAKDRDNTVLFLSEEVNKV